MAHVVDEDPDETAVRYAPILVPMAALHVAHYFSCWSWRAGLLVPDLEPLLQRLGPLGTDDNTVDFNLVSTATIPGSRPAIGVGWSAR